MAESLFENKANVDMLERQWQAEEADGSDSVQFCAKLLKDMFPLPEGPNTPPWMTCTEFNPIPSVLDVGCGLGRLERMLPAGTAYYGIDQSAEMVSRCGRPNFGQGSVYQLPFDDQRFDAVVCNAVLFHVGDIPRAMKELWRVTRKRLVVSLYWKWGIKHKGPQVIWAEDAETGRGFPSVQNVVPRWMVKRLAGKFGARNVDFHWRDDIGLWREKVVFVVMDK